MPPRAPTAGAQGSRPEVPLVPPSGGELVVGRIPTISVPPRQRPVKAVSAPRPMGVGAASSSVLNTEATSAAPPDWTSGAGSGVLNVAVQDILAQFNTHVTTLLQSGRSFWQCRRPSGYAVRFLFLILVIFRGGTPAHPLGVVPEFWVDC